ncbi:hypothetical protein SDRG_01130 [Saprolegnia diclina VS20]|uniref:Zinc finger CCHC domain-containing protein 10 n=1 Tax=Saprolegnia diclina (strain VS20) TaxID=1156394 RepID=T0SE44_SAPDV|nr:hypothetical protein SDRG_01130 [Saprolegnia diclina VS20]EQC41152.1 hypothetical protein SDRG_01130 [Saprolegnia diclina VS20]|eukprot:XP_008604866.1 hypothetical protein SDRG_01130 [Saprolegnia diclina VS20]
MDAKRGMLYGRAGLGSRGKDTGAVNATCQKCLKKGHWTYECQGQAVYLQRPSRTQVLANPRLRRPFSTDTLQSPHDAKDKKREAPVKAKKARRKASVSSSSSSSSSSSDSSSSSSSDSSGSDSDSSSSSDSEDDRPAKKTRKSSE